MKTGDIILSRNNTNFGRIVSDKTGSYWTHINIARDDNSVNEFSLFSNKVMTLDELLNDSSVKDYTVIEDVADINDYMRINEIQKNACYESLWGLSSLLKKLKSCRDSENIQTSPVSYTCATSIARGLQDKLNLPFHYSQSIPEDFEMLKKYT